MIRTTLTWWPPSATMPDREEAVLVVVPDISDVALVASFIPALGFRTPSGRVISSQRVLAWAYWPEVPAVLTTEPVGS